MRNIFDGANVAWQTGELGKVDAGGGGTVAKYIANTAAEIGEAVALVDFVRFEKGEGLAKKEENFADEVASMIK